ncbi:MAG: AsmA-like C-terminal domain-containing protein [Candidatus Hydrogenedentota bacterium]
MFAALVPLWLVAERYVLRVDRYRPALEDAIAGATGLSASIERIEAHLLPWPYVALENVTVGSGDFWAFAERIDVRGELRALARGRLEIDLVEVKRLSVVVPPDPDDIRERVNVLIDHLTAPSQEEPWFSEVSVIKVETEDAGVYLKGDAEPAAVITVTGRDVLSDAVQTLIEARLPEYGADARAWTTLNFTLAEQNVLAVSGEGSFEGLELASLPLDGLPQIVMHAGFTLSGENFGSIEAALTGNTASVDTGQMTGEYAGALWWKDEALTLNDFTWIGPDVNTALDLTRHKDGRIVVSVKRFSARAGGLSDILAGLKLKDAEVTAGPDASFAATDLLFALESDDTIQFSQGNAEFSGLALAHADEGELAHGVKGHVTITDGTIAVEELVAEGLALHGNVTPNPGWTTFALDLSGNADLAAARVVSLVFPDSVHDAQGVLAIDRIAGTFDRNGALPDDLVLTATVNDGAFRVESEDFTAAFESVNVQVRTDGKTIATAASAASPELGAMHLDGQYSVADRLWSGATTIDVPKAATHFIDDDEVSARLAGLLDQYGTAEWKTDVQFAAEDGDPIEVRVSGENAPMLNGKVLVATNEEHTRFGDVHVETELASDRLPRLLPEGIRAEGPVTVRFDRDATAGEFTATANLTGCTLTTEGDVQKRFGDELLIDLSGQATEGTWRAEKGALTCLGQQLDFIIEDKRVVAPHFDIAAVAWARLLPEGASAHGRIFGKAAFNPFEADLTFHDQGFRLDDEIVIERINGNVSISGPYLTCRDLKIEGARSDCTVNAGRSDGVWRGEVRGRTLDVNAFAPLAGALIGLAQSGGSPKDATEKSEADPFVGDFNIALDQVFFRKGRLDKFTAMVNAREQGVFVKDIRCTPYSGSLTGTIDWVPSNADEHEVRVSLAFDGADSRIVDEILMNDERGLDGIFSGTLDFSSPAIEGKESVKRANGRAEIRAANGSLGKMGWATKLISVLKTTEILAFRRPEFRDKGLTYDDLSGRLEMVNGVLTLRDVKLESPSYSMTARGTVDFPQDRSDVVVRVQPLENINRTVGRIPIIGDAIRQVTKVARVRVNITGSPYDTSQSAQEDKE